MTWRVNREAAIFLGAGRALLLQLAHPWIATTIAEHSQALDDPIGRFHRTFSTTFTMVFGTLGQALTAARRLHRRHAAIFGTLPAAAGPFAGGSMYQANEIAALRWVYATLTETALTMHDLILPALTDEERERYYAESNHFAGLFGIPRASLPENWRAFATYVEMMQQSDTDTARAIAQQLLAGTKSPRRLLKWYRALTAQMLPPLLRDAFGLKFDDPERRAAERAITWIRRVYPLVPTRLRQVGPYQEAEARLLGRTPPDLATQLLNRFWIGRKSLAG
jgi:uncharacterized protein (DUF2236 family)